MRFKNLYQHYWPYFKSVRYNWLTVLFTGETLMRIVSIRSMVFISLKEDIFW